MGDSDLLFMPATDLIAEMRAGRVSAFEVMEAHLLQIDRLNPAVNAIVTLLPERALMIARAADEVYAHGGWTGPLHGVPLAHKDLFETNGVRTTFGSVLFKDYFPDHDDLLVERSAAAGGISVGKTNTPEFGSGATTFNSLFGTTVNPYDWTRTSGGSSGGAAAALACGMIALADGSDMGGSVRTPAAFCNVVGFRPSLGRVPAWPRLAAWYGLVVDGPLARTVGDVALMLSVLAGPDGRSPVSLSDSGSIFSNLDPRNFKGVRIAWMPKFAGLPVDGEIEATVEAQRKVFEDIGCVPDEVEPDLRDADLIFKVWRGWYYQMAFGDLVENHPDEVRESVIQNVEFGSKLRGGDIADAERKRTALYHRLREFMQTYEFLVLPTTSVPPFDASNSFVSEIDGVVLDSYTDWVKPTYYISVTGLPAISVPCGFTSDGLPVGIQIVGRYRDDLGVLQLAKAFESATGFWKRRPQIVM